MPEKSTFHPVDFVVFLGVIGFSLGVGGYYAFVDRKKQSAQEYLMGGRKMPILPVTLSLLASFLSAIALLGTPAEIYLFGTQYVVIGLSYCLMIPMAIYVYMPVFYDLGITSVFEYLEMRFARCVRTSASLIYIGQMTIYLAMVLYAPCLALEAVTGLNVWISVVVIGTSCTIYTTIGGMKAVMWTDAAQTGMMYAAMLAVLVQGCIINGGMSEVWRKAVEGNRIEFFNFDPNPSSRHTVWSLTIGGCFTWAAVYAVNQAQVQRVMSCPSLRNAKIAMWLNLPGLLILMLLCAMCGLVLFATFGHCDPLKRREITASDQLGPLFVMTYLAMPGLPGMFVAGLFSGSLSTLSSGYNALAAVFMRDIIQNHYLHNSDDKRDALISKVLACVFGVICTALCYPISLLGQLLTAALGIFGLIGGPVLGVFTLGLLVPWANWKGALAGLWGSLAFLLWIGVGFYVYNPVSPKLPTYVDQCPVLNVTTNSTVDLLVAGAQNLTALATPMVTNAPVTTTLTGIQSIHTLSYMWYSFTAVLAVIAIALPVTAATGWIRAGDADLRLLSPVIRRFAMAGSHSLTKPMASNAAMVADFGDSKVTLATEVSFISDECKAAPASNFKRSADCALNIATHL